MLVQVQPAIRAAWATGRTDHQAQHAVAPATDQVLVGFGQQVVDFVDTLRVDVAQRSLGEIVTGVEECVGLGAGVLLGRRPTEVILVVAEQRGAAAGVARVEEEVLHVDRDELQGAAGFVDIGAARDLAVVLFAFTATADILRPTGEVQQARIIAEGEASVILATAFIRQADQPGDAVLAAAAANERALTVGPQARTVIDVGQFMQHSGEHFPAHGAVGAIGFTGGSAAVGQAGEEVAIEVQLGHQGSLAVSVVGHLVGPADIDAPVKLLDKARRQGAHRFIEQCLAGLLFSRAQAFCLEPQLQAGVGCVGT